MQISLTFAIAVVFIIFIILLSDLIFPSPKYEDYCTENYAAHPISLNENKTNKINERNIECNNNYNELQQKNNRNVFIIMAILGLIAVIFSIFLNVESMSAGLIFGGSIVMIIGTSKIFGDVGRLLRTLIAGIGLVLLIYFTYKINKKNGDKSSRVKKILRVK